MILWTSYQKFGFKVVFSETIVEMNFELKSESCLFIGNCCLYIFFWPICHFFCWKMTKKLKSDCKGQKSFFNVNQRVNYFSEEEGNFVNLRLFLYWESLLIYIFWTICHFFLLKNDKKKLKNAIWCEFRVNPLNAGVALI